MSDLSDLRAQLATQTKPCQVMLRQLFAVAALLIVFAQVLNAQTTITDILYLKNGSVIRGTIIELVPESTVKIRTIDGSIFVYEMEDVERIEKSENAVMTGVRNPYTIQRKISSFGLGAAMAATMAGSLSMGDDYFGTTAIPIVGPFVTIARIEDDPYRGYLPGGQQLLIAAGAIQTAFLVYFVYSLAKEKSWEPGLAVSPTIGNPGVAVLFRF